MAQTSATSPGTMANDSSDGTYAWSNVDNAKISDNSYATTNWTGGATSQYLKATNFGFSIPSGATINGILAEVEVKGNATCNAYWVYVVKADGTFGGTSKGNLDPLPETDTYTSFGASDDLWDETWTAENINDADFGVAYRITAYNGPISVDHIRITIYYTEAGEETVGPFPTFLI